VEMRLIFKNPIAIIFWAALTFMIIYYIYIFVIFSKGYIYSMAVVYKVEIGPKGGCRIYYLYEYENEILANNASNPGEPCEGNYFKGQMFSVKIATSNPKISQLNGKIKGKDKINVDSLYQLYLAK